MIRRSYGVNFRVELFGSTLYGVDTPTSDIDLVIVVRTRFQPHPIRFILNFDQDTNLMEGFSPTLDLSRLPGK